MTDHERQLRYEIEQAGNLPRHVAIIMDGNGRWAGGRGLPRLGGHEAGVTPVRESVRACAELGVEVLTLYAFSTENWNRPAAEIAGLMKLLKNTLQKEQAELDDNNVVLRTIGRTHELPKDVQEQIAKTSRALSHNDGLILNLALSYGGRGEIVDAVKTISKEIESGSLTMEDLDESVVARHLYTADLPEPDLLIRTSGELRVSNFLLWQIAYAEIWVTDVAWPDFGRIELYEAIRSYQDRDRRFGRVESLPRRAAKLVSPFGGKK